jgi:hypothetical protein
VRTITQSSPYFTLAKGSSVKGRVFGSLSASLRQIANLIVPLRRADLLHGLHHVGQSGIGLGNTLADGVHELGGCCEFSEFLVGIEDTSSVEDEGSSRESKR